MTIKIQTVHSNPFYDCDDYDDKDRYDDELTWSFQAFCLWQNSDDDDDDDGNDDDDEEYDNLKLPAPLPGTKGNNFSPSWTTDIPVFTLMIMRLLMMIEVVVTLECLAPMCILAGCAASWKGS